MENKQTENIKVDGNKILDRISQRMGLKIGETEKEVAILIEQIDELQNQNKLLQETINRLKSNESSTNTENE